MDALLALLLVRHGDDGFHADCLGVVERALAFVVRRHVDRAHAVAGHAEVGALLLEGVDLRLRGFDRQVEVLDAEVMKVELLHKLERLVKRQAVAREAGHAELELHFPIRRGAARSGGYGLGANRAHRERTKSHERAAVNHLYFLRYCEPSSAPFARQAARLDGTRTNGPARLKCSAGLVCQIPAPNARKNGLHVIRDN